MDDENKTNQSDVENEPIFNGNQLGSQFSIALKKFIVNIIGSVSSLVTDASILFSDITTNNASITKHGFLPKLPNDASKFLNGVGAFSTPAGSVTGSGTTNKLPMWTGSTALGDSPFSYDSGNAALNTNNDNIEMGSGAVYFGGTNTESIAVSGSDLFLSASAKVNLNGALTADLSGLTVTLPGLAGGGTQFVKVNTSGVLSAAAASPGSFTTVSGTDSLGATACPVNVTHTITHGLGIRPTLFSIAINGLVPPQSTGGTGGSASTGSGWLYLDTNGNPIGGFTYNTQFTSSFGSPPAEFAFSTTSVTGTTVSSAGPSTATITINNVTATTFDIVYTASTSNGTPNFSYSSVNWTAMG